MIDTLNIYCNESYHLQNDGHRMRIRTEKTLRMLKPPRGTASFLCSHLVNEIHILWSRPRKKSRGILHTRSELSVIESSDRIQEVSHA